MKLIDISKQISDHIRGQEWKRSVEHYANKNLGNTHKKNVCWNKAAKNYNDVLGRHVLQKRASM